MNHFRPLPSPLFDPVFDCPICRRRGWGENDYRAKHSRVRRRRLKKGHKP